LYNNEIINLSFSCKGEASTSVLGLYVIVALPDDARSQWLKHVIENVINE